jgi:hypothetical protein
MKLCRAPYGLGNSSDEASVIGNACPQGNGNVWAPCEMKMHWYALGSNCSLRKGPPIGVFLLLEPVHFQPTAMQTRCHFGSSVITPLLRPNVLLGLCTPWTMSSWVPTWATGAGFAPFALSCTEHPGFKP